MKGEPSALEGMTDLLIKTIDEKQITADGSQKVQIALPAGLINVENTESATINITHKNTSTKIITVDNIKINNPKHLNYDLITQDINITFRGPAASITALQPIHVTATATLDYEGSTGIITAPVVITISNQYSGTVYEIGGYNIKIRVN